MELLMNSSSSASMARAVAPRKDRLIAAYVAGGFTANSLATETAGRGKHGIPAPQVPAEKQV